MHKQPDPFTILELYKSQCKLEAYKELSSKIEIFYLIFNAHSPLIEKPLQNDIYRGSLILIYFLFFLNMF